MKKVFKQALSFLLVAIMIVTVIPLAGLQVKVNAGVFSFNLDDMVNYALTYWDNYNPNYSNYNSVGGDCCNFVSQCLHEGGLDFTDGWYYHSYSDRTSSWTLCSDLKNYLCQWLSCEYISSPSASQVEPGDVLYYGGGSHVGICTEKIDGVPWVCAHNNDRHTSSWKLGFTTYAVIKTSKLATDNPSSLDIKEGVYVIQNVRDPSKVLDLTGNGTESGTLLQLFDKEYTQVQKFRIINYGGYYCIKSVYADKWVDISQPVYGEAYHSIQLWNDDSNPEEHWVFEDAGNGNVYIKCPSYNVYLDYSGTPQNNTKICTYPYSGDTAQQWKLIRVSGNASMSVDEGTYIIQNVRDPSKVMDLRYDDTANGTRIQLYDKVYNQVQKFKIINMGAYYCIKSVYADKYIDICQPVVGESHHNVQLWYENTNNEEKWIFEDAGNGNVFIRSYYDVYIDTGGPTASSTELITYNFDDSTSQQWKLIKVSETPKVKIEDGIYFFQMVRNPNKFMDIQSNSKENYTPLQLYDALYNQVQKFRVVNVGNYCYIQSIYAPDKYIDISHPEINESGHKIQLYFENTNEEEKWIFEDAGNGNVFIRSFYDVYIDSGGPTNNHTELITYKFDGTTSQQWKLIKTTEDLEQPKVSINKTKLAVGETAMLSWTGCEHVSSYWVSAWSSKEHVISEELGNNQFSKAVSFEEPGRYSITSVAYYGNDYTGENLQWLYLDIVDNITVSFDTSVSSLQYSDKVINLNSPYGELPVPARTGYKFLGWFTSVTGGTQVTADTIVPTTAEQTLYAQWERNTFVEKTEISVNVADKFIFGENLIGMTATDLAGQFENSNINVSMQTSRMATGTTVNLIDDENIVYDTLTVVIFGDVNCDGWYDGTDSIIVNCLANGLLSREQVGEAVYMAADCNHDDVIDEADVAILEQAGIILASVDQTKTEAELMTDSAYVEYLNLIDQNPTEETPVEETPTDVTPTDEPVDGKLNVFDWLIGIFIRIFNYIKLYFSIIK